MGLVFEAFSYTSGDVTCPEFIASTAVRAYAGWSSVMVLRAYAHYEDMRNYVSIWWRCGIGGCGLRRCVGKEFFATGALGFAGSGYRPSIAVQLLRRDGIHRPWQRVGTNGMCAWGFGTQGRS